MRTTRWCGWLCVLVVLAATTSRAAPAKDEGSLYELVEVSPSVTMALNSNGSNISCVALDDGLVFFDASLSTRTATAFRRAMEARFGRPTRALVLTHAHVDHVLGMGAFADVPVFAAAAGRPRWEQLVGMEWDERAIASWASVFPSFPQELPDASLRLPTDWFDDELVLGAGEDDLVVRRTGGHTVDSSSVSVEGGRVVIAGDLVQARRRPYFGEPDTDFGAWIATLLGWEALEVEAVCPGHGPVIGGAELRAIRVWFEQASAAMAEQKSRGLTFGEVAAGDGLPAGYWPEGDAVPGWWAFCIKRLYDAS